MRRVVVLAAGVIIAGAALVMSTGAGPSASIEGPALHQPPPEETAKFENVTIRGADQPKPPPKPAPSADIDLDRAALVGDHYQLPDGRRLTLDPQLQDTAEKILAEARAPRAAIVVLAPDGKILALAGRRGEPKDGSKGVSDWHLATDAWAPAASVF